VVAARRDVSIVATAESPVVRRVPRDAARSSHDHPTPTAVHDDENRTTK